MARTPNHALQRTAPRVTVAAVLAWTRLVRSWLCPTSVASLCAPPSQLPRHAPPSLSLGSLGVIARVMWLSPKYKDTDFERPLKLDDKITIFLDRTDGWQLSIAEQCGAIPHSAFAVLHIILSYFETIAKYQSGFAQNGQSAHHFKRGVELVFPPIMDIPDYVRDAILTDLYSGARCGLYHGSMTAAHIAVSGLEQGDFRYDPNTRSIVIDPGRMTKTLRQHLTAYGAQLRDPANADLRARFESRFDFDASHPQGAAWQQP